MSFLRSRLSFFLSQPLQRGGLKPMSNSSEIFCVLKKAERPYPATVRVSDSCAGLGHSGCYGLLSMKLVDLCFRPAGIAVPAGLGEGAQARCQYLRPAGNFGPPRARETRSGPGVGVATLLWRRSWRCRRSLFRCEFPEWNSL